MTNTKIHKTGLIVTAKKLTKDLTNTSISYADFVTHCSTYQELCTDLDAATEYASYVNETLDRNELRDIAENIEYCKNALLLLEQSRDIFETAMEIAFQESNVQPDELKPLTISLMVDLISFSGPAPRLIPMLVRGLSKRTYIDQSVIFNAPTWFARWLVNHERHSGITIEKLHEVITDLPVLESANVLWTPFTSYGQTAYITSTAAIDASRLLN